MKKKLLTLLLALVAIMTTAQAQVVLNEENFPDELFRNAVANYDTDFDGHLSVAEIASAKRFPKGSYSTGIVDFTGIEYLTALEEFVGPHYYVKSLDFSKNTKLKTVSITGCERLEKVDVTKCLYLEILNIVGVGDSYNDKIPLSNIDVSNNMELKMLRLLRSNVVSVDISKNTKLEILDIPYQGVFNGTQWPALKTLAIDGNIDDQGITSVDVSMNTKLTSLSVSNANLTSFDVSKNNATLTSLSISNVGLTSIDVSKNTKLTSLSVSNSNFTSLDVSKNTALEELYCYGNQLTALDVSKNTALTILRCFNNQLTSLDVSNNTALKRLECYKNQIKGEAMDALVASLPTVENSKFYVINTKDENEGNVCTKAQVAVAKGKGWTVYDYNGGSIQEYEGSDDAAAKLLLNAENFPDANFRAALAKILGISEGDEITEAKIAATTELNVNSKSIADLKGIEHFTALTSLSCGGNRLTSLDVSGCTALTELECSWNQLTSLDVSKNSALTELYCTHNQLTSLDVSKNTALIELWCDNNQLTLLNVSKNTALTKLYCFGNQLTSLDVSQNTELTGLWCHYNQMTSLDVSGRTLLTILQCDNNQLTSLDVSNNTALTSLICSNNQLTLLDVSKNTALKYLYCYGNQLTSLDVSNNTALKRLECYKNQIKGEAMDALVASLPTAETGKFYVIDTKDENEGNVCTKSQVAVAKGKGWKVYDYNGGVYDENYEYPEYEGSDPVEEDIDPVDEDDNIDFGSDMDENDDLNGNVIGDIFYNIGNGNGEYNAEEGCIVLKKTTDDETVDGLSGKDIFGEDFKGQFTGIVFKVPSGKGTVKVTAETTGNMLLKVKIGNNDPVDMELEGKLKISFPYSVTEETFVYIYAGVSNEAKGFGKASSTDAALKIYGIEFLRDDTTPIDASLNDNEKMINDSWYTIDGKKLSGEPTKKGVYIHKGKKVKK